MNRVRVAALVLVVVSNALILGGVWYNRQGQPAGQLWLTERELPLRHYRHDENSAVILPLQWRVAVGDSPDAEYFRSNSLAMTADELRALGFEIRPDAEPGFYSRQLARQAYVALEYGGEAYRRDLRYWKEREQEARQRHEAAPGDEQRELQYRNAQLRYDDVAKGTRLYAVDIGSDRDSLQRQYREPGRYVVVKAVVGLTVFDPDDELPGLYIQRLDVRSIFVPRPYRDRLLALAGGEESGYRLKITWGSRLEPWVSDFRPQ